MISFKYPSTNTSHNLLIMKITLFIIEFLIKNSLKLLKLLIIPSLLFNLYLK